MPAPAINLQVEGAFGFAKYDPDQDDFPRCTSAADGSHYGIVAEGQHEPRRQRRARRAERR
jgi:hypothetical protein